MLYFFAFSYFTSGRSISYDHVVIRPVMALIGCQRCGRSDPLPKMHEKMALPTQDIALFFHSSTRTSMTCQKDNKKILNRWLQRARLLHVMFLPVVKAIFFKEHHDFRTKIGNFETDSK